jgi:DNA repair protein SbcC/Rad50
MKMRPASWAQAKARRQQTEARRQQDGATLQALHEWLEQHASRRELAQGWPRWEALLERANALQQQQKNASEQVGQLQDRAQQQSSQLEQDQAGVERSDAACTQAGERLEQASTACAGSDAEALAAENSALQARREALRALGQTGQRLQQLEQRHAAQAQRRAAQSDALQAAQSQLDALARELPSAEAAFASAQQALQTARLAASASAEALRASLQPGLPCPVCGSTEHPRAQAATAVDSMLEALEAHALECRQALDELLQRQAGARTRQQLAAQALGEIDADLATLARERVAAQAEWDAQAPQAGCAELLPEQREGWLAQQQAAAQAQLQALQERETVLRQQLREREQARLALDAARAERDRLRQQVQALQQQAALNAQQLQAERQLLARLEQETEALLSQLDAAFPRAAWRKQWLADAPAYCDRLRQQVQEWTTAREKTDALQAALQGLAQEAESRQQAQQQASRLEQAQALALQQVEAELAQYHQQRAALFEGRAADEVATALQGEVERGDALQSRSLETLHQARQQQTRLLEAQHQTGLRLSQHETVLQQTGQALRQWLDDFNARATEAAATLTLDELDRLLAIPGESLRDDRLSRRRQVPPHRPAATRSTCCSATPTGIWPICRAATGCSVWRQPDPAGGRSGHGRRTPLGAFAVRRRILPGVAGAGAGPRLAVVAQRQGRIAVHRRGLRQPRRRNPATWRWTRSTACNPGSQGRRDFACA